MRLWRSVAAVGLVVLAAGPATAAAEDPDAVVHRTELGTVHITADDETGLGYGYGRAVAQDHLCLLAEAYVTVAGERSRWFGPDATFVFHANKARHSNLDSDLYARQVLASGVTQRLLSAPAPVGVRPEVQDLVRGYVAGYNRSVREARSRGTGDPRCRDEEWVRPITEELAYARFFQLAALAGGGLAISGIGKAQPPLPSSSAGVSAPDPRATAEAVDELGERLGLGGLGSNAIALGRTGTRSGAGMVLANPHLPWKGDYRLYQAQLTIPGKFDVTGATFIGVPLVVIGHTAGLAWSHTTSSAFRFTPVEVPLVPGSPTSYLVDGQRQEMTSRRITVPVRRPDGTVGEVTRTLWSTRYGPVLTELLGLPLFPWTPTTATAFHDANAENLRYLNHFYELAAGRTVEDLDRITRTNQGIPWATTVAADSGGHAYFADASVTPHVTDELAQRCSTALGVATFAQLRLPILDGSRSSCDWGTDPDAVVPGIFGPRSLPFQRRDDYVLNSNDSHWLANAAAPLEGFARIVGSERTERSLRTRLSLRMVKDGMPFSLEGLQELQMNDRNGSAELVVDDLVGLCRSLPVLPSPDGGVVDRGDACEVLARWDRREREDSRGALLYRRFAQRAFHPPIPGDNAVGGGAPAIGTWSDAFDPGDPVGTPRRLATANPLVAQALGGAVSDLRGAGIPLDAPLGDWQVDSRGTSPVPIHGGNGDTGIFNAMNVEWDPGRGFPEIAHGATFMMASELRGACPPTRTLVAYSQSSDPRSPHHQDQTRMYAQRRWATERFCAADVLASPELQAQRSGCLPGRWGSARGGVAHLTAGTTARRARTVLGAPDRRGRNAWRWCVAGGGQLRAALAGAGRRTVVLVGTTAPRHRIGGVRPGGRVAGRRWRWLGSGLRVRALEGDRRAVALTTRAGRARWVAVVRARDARSAATARRLARRAGLPVR